MNQVRHAASRSPVSASPVRRPSRCHLMTPTDWFRIPLRSEVKRQRAVSHLVDRTYPNRDQHAAQRRELLTGMVERAVLHDGVELYLSTQAVLGLPVPASLLVSVEPEDPALPEALPVKVLVEGLRKKYGERAEAQVELPSGSAVRVLRRELGDDARELGQPADRPATVLEVHVSVPGRVRGCCWRSVRRCRNWLRRRWDVRPDRGVVAVVVPVKRGRV